MAKIKGKEYPGVEPVLKVSRTRFHPHNPQLCSSGGMVSQGLRLGRDDDPADLGRPEVNFALDGPDGLPLDRKVIR